MSKPKSKKIPLAFPISVKSENGDEVTVSEITLKRLKAKHLKLLPSSFMEDEGKINPGEILPLIAGITNLSEDAVGEIDAEDLMKIAEEMEAFLESFPVTGKK